MSSTLRERTVLPPENPADLVRFARGLADAEAPAQAKLVSPDGSQLDIPAELYELLRALSGLPVRHAASPRRSLRVPAALVGRRLRRTASQPHAEVIVTFNLRDFPEPALKPYDIAAIHPDDFLLDQLDLYPGLTMDVLRHQAASYRRAPNTVPEVLVLLQRTGVPRFAAEVRRHLGPPAW